MLFGMLSWLDIAKWCNSGILIVMFLTNLGSCYWTQHFTSGCTHKFTKCNHYIVNKTQTIILGQCPWMKKKKDLKTKTPDVVIIALLISGLQVVCRVSQKIFMCLKLICRSSCFHPTQLIMLMLWFVQWTTLAS